MDACNWKVHVRHGDILNSCQATSPLVRLMEGVERREVSAPQGILPLNWGGIKLNRIVTFIVFKAVTANDCVHLEVQLVSSSGNFASFSSERATTCN
ncbi:hypothetical protein TNCV_2552791 [Trichonephila clavipes]|nr:hypothetical protein TNCV_2552791 [Trichonephila clavipes]